MPVSICPNCGAELRPIAIVGGHPPWACDPCQRAWWTAELDARGDWDPVSRSFTDPEVAINATTEQLAAEIRGSSVTPDTAQAVPVEQLVELLEHEELGPGIREIIEPLVEGTS